MQNHIVIVGGGFGGVRAAQRCDRLLPKNVRITLVSDKPYLQYYGALYRLLGGASPLEACVPLCDLLAGTRVEVMQDRILAIDPQAHTARGASHATYRYDQLILALGSEPNFFGVPGIAEHAFTLKSLDDALRLRRHIHETFEAARMLPPSEQSAYANIVVIGAGPTGLEVAGELALHARRMAKDHGLPPSAVTIDLVEAMPRVVPGLPESVSGRIETRLRELGVHLFLSRGVEREERNVLRLHDITFRSRTVVWTAGVKAHRLHKEIPGVTVDKRDRVVVDAHLRAKGVMDLWVIGDGAATPLSGMAQTALQDADHVAESLSRTLRGKPLLPYAPHRPAYAIPVGSGWAAVAIGPLRFFGRIGWWLRQAADMKVLFLYLSPLRAIKTFFAARA